MKKVSFMDIAVCLNCHVFIIWEFIRKYGYTAGVTKDKYGRGYAEVALCNGWVDKLAKYVAAQDFTYKQTINKRQYLVRDETRFAEEKRNEQDISRTYGIDPDGRIKRVSTFKNGKTQTWYWAPGFARVEIDIMIVSSKDVSNQVIAISPNLITKCQIWAFVYIQKKEALKLTYFMHSCTVKNPYCAGLCAV